MTDLPNLRSPARELVERVTWSEYRALWRRYFARSTDRRDINERTAYAAETFGAAQVSPIIREHAQTLLAKITASNNRQRILFNAYDRRKDLHREAYDQDFGFHHATAYLGASNRIYETVQKLRKGA